MLALLPAVKRQLAREGVEPTAVRATTVSRRRRRSSARATTGSAPTEVAEASARLRAVLRWTPVAAKCLEESLVLCRYLSRRGIQTELVVAVRKYPFEAHAWVEWDGQALTPLPEVHPEQFRVISRYPRRMAG